MPSWGNEEQHANNPSGEAKIDCWKVSETMFKNILVPLDGSTLAECVLPHALSLSTALDAHAILLHVLERPRDTGSLQPVDPLRWVLKKHEAEGYLKRLSIRFEESGLDVEYVLQEGAPAKVIINHSNLADVDLIVLSTHGSSGLSGWNVSSVVQKIILRANKSLMLVRAYQPSEEDAEMIHYRRIFVGLDASARAELVLPVAVRLAQYYKASLTLGTVVQKPELVSRLPLSDEDTLMIERITERNKKAATHYLEQVRAQLSPTGIKITTRLEICTNTLSCLHNMVEEEKADLVMLVAHGRSADGRWPYGSVTTSFIAYGGTSLFIMQDLSADDIQRTMAEQAMLKEQGH
jgi:nucleotide-binding universal stress UspA family protein